MNDRSKKDRRHDDPAGMQEYEYERASDTVTFEVLTDRIHAQKVECNEELDKKLTVLIKGVITWKVATGFLCSALLAIAGATWAIRDKIDEVKKAIPIEKITDNTTFAADKIKTIEAALVSKTDSINKDAVEKALKIIQVEKQK
jgi:hypothetical protein